MKTPIAITDVTRMQGQRVCVAGYRRDYTCIRPVRRGGLTETWLYDQQAVIVRPFAIVEIDLHDHAPDPPHTEDWEIEPVYRSQQGMMTTEQAHKLLVRIDDGAVANIFGAQIHHDQGFYLQAGEGERSLGTIQSSELYDLWLTPQSDGSHRYALVFTDQTGEWYRLSVSDLSFRAYLDHLHDHEGMPPDEAARQVLETLQQRELFLRIGLSRGWNKHPDRCYLQITGVHTFPDYLDGRSFADFMPPPSEPPTDEELPF